MNLKEERKKLFTAASKVDKQLDSVLEKIKETRESVFNAAFEEKT